MKSYLSLVPISAKVTYLVCSAQSERATDTLDKKIKKLIRKDMELNAANARK